jgi:hypothetical protein
MKLGKIYKIRTEKLQTWIDWCDELNNTLYQEAKQTLSEEGAVFEIFINFKLNNDWYTVGLTMPFLGELKPTNLDKAINRKHRQIIRECLEPIGEGESGYFLQNY